jgi:lipid-binding SYLF domain-containing protein
MKTISKTITTLFFVFLSVSLASASRDEKLKKTSAYAIELLKDTDSKLKDRFKNAYGYVIFPNVGKGDFGIGGAFGKGEVYQNGKFLGEARLTQGTIGLQMGGQLSTEVIFLPVRESVLLFFRTRSLRIHTSSMDPISSFPTADLPLATIGASCHNVTI